MRSDGVKKKEPSEYLHVVADGDSGIYSITMSLEWSEPKSGVVVTFPKWELADALEKASRFETEGLRDKHAPGLPPREVYREREVPVYKEREIIREIVKVRCRHCGTLFEERLGKCPQCGSPG
jgi:hypothetical protein